jgi:hypothetical protein
MITNRKHVFLVLCGAATLALARKSPAVVATGGNMTNDMGGYRIHTFTNSVTAGNFAVTADGNVEVLVVAGGGGGPGYLEWNTPGRPGGSGGAGTANNPGLPGTNGLGGGGGSGYQTESYLAGGKGGSGIVIVRYPLNAAASDLPQIANVGLQGRTDTSASVTGLLTTNGTSPATVYLYWSTADGTTNAATWTGGGSVSNLGTRADGTTFTNTIGPLIPNTTSKEAG